MGAGHSARPTPSNPSRAPPDWLDLRRSPILDILTNAPRDIRFGDLVLKVGALKIRELGLLQRWIREHAVPPSVRLQEQLKILPEEDHKKLRYETAIAERTWPPSINSQAGNAVLFDDPDGQLYFLGVMLRKFQPTLADETLNTIAEGLSEIDFGVLTQIAFGEDDLDPKEVRAVVLSRLETIREAARAALEGQDEIGLENSTLEGEPAPSGESSSVDSGNPLPTSRPGTLPN